MSNLDTEIQEIADQITRLVRAAYRRGETDALERVLRAARSNQDTTEQALVAVSRSDSAEREPRKRAPKGTVEVLVGRTLADGRGRKPDEIKEHAENDDERMIAVSSIRAHLRKGEKEGRYVRRGGRWHGVTIVTTEKPEATDPVGGRVASEPWSTQEDHR